MSIMMRLAIVFVIWAFLLLLANPFFEGRKRVIAMFCCVAAATFCFVFDGVL